jgi:(p)ppGpp synthase/HD superfamily hydrolase
MHCYQYLAAVNAVATTIETCPEAGQTLPYSVVADWMEENGIEPEEIMLISGDEVRAIVENVIRRDQPHLPHAA